MKAGKIIGTINLLITSALILATFVLSASRQQALAGDLPEVQKAGVLRHLGVPYANFVTGSGDGLDMELIKLFADHLGVRYEYIKTDWDNAISDLTGKQIRVAKGEVTTVGEAPVKGDVIANGMTIIPWRQKVLDFSQPTFPTQVWLVAKADSAISPITPAGDTMKDIVLTKEALRGISTMGKLKTCLDPDLYQLSDYTAKITIFDGALNDLAPAILSGKSETTILDVPDALVALEKWPGQLKVIGPISDKQEMGAAFAKTSPLLRNAFNKFFEIIKADGTYSKLVNKYYPEVFSFYPEFFSKQQISQ